MGYHAIGIGILLSAVSAQLILRKENRNKICAGLQEKNVGSAILGSKSLGRSGYPKHTFLFGLNTLTKSC